MGQEKQNEYKKRLRMNILKKYQDDTRVCVGQEKHFCIFVAGAATTMRVGGGGGGYLLLHYTTYTTINHFHLA